MSTDHHSSVDPDSATSSREAGRSYDELKARTDARSQRRAQSHAGNADGWTATGTLLSGIVVWGLIGWGLKAWTGWTGFLPIGVLLGAALGVYLVVKEGANPPPLMDISKAQDGGLVKRTPERPTDEGHTRNV